MFAILLLTITFHSNFAGGSAGNVEQVSETYFRVPVEGQADQNGRNRQASWYYFRIDGTAQRPLTIALTNLAGEYNFKPDAYAIIPQTRPFYSYDDQIWEAFEDDQVSWDDQRKELVMRFTPRQSTVWIAHVPPYTERNLRALESAMSGHPALRTRSAGKTVEGRDMPLWTITDPETPEQGKKVIWLMARQHAWESPTSWVAEGLIRFLLSDDPQARQIQRGAVFQIFPMADPDGVANGMVRFNRNGYDLNRNWDVHDPERMPEIASQKGAIFDWLDSGRRVDLFLSLHNTETSEYITGLPDGASAEQKAVAGRLYELLQDGTTFQASRSPFSPGASTTPGMKGRMSVNQGLFAERKITAILMEQRVTRHPKLGRAPGVQDRLAFGRQLAVALWKSVAQP